MHIKCYLLRKIHLWHNNGLPESIVLDRRVQFVVGMMKKLNHLLGIQTKLSIAYHPQTDGQTERINQELEQYLRVFINHRQEQWPDWLGMVEFTYNNKIHAVTKILLFKANYGQDLSQTSFSHISINSSLILMVSMATESPWKDLSIDTSYVSRQSIIVEILGRLTGNCKGTTLRSLR